MKLTYLRSVNGFSFTELVLVLVIVGVMASLSLVVFSDQLVKGRHKKTLPMMHPGFNQYRIKQLNKTKYA